ncbi:hypothetical protein B0H14DRAFT_3696247 [Mycena olivaceomarginata]|nr:hypothetical protein B0H14DRAFT_3696247 [Mycena olivaceomarginata]
MRPRIHFPPPPPSRALPVRSRHAPPHAPVSSLLPPHPLPGDCTPSAPFSLSAVSSSAATRVSPAPMSPPAMLAADSNRYSLASNSDQYHPTVRGRGLELISAAGGYGETPPCSQHGSNTLRILPTPLAVSRHTTASAGISSSSSVSISMGREHLSKDGFGLDHRGNTSAHYLLPGPQSAVVDTWGNSYGYEPSPPMPPPKPHRCASMESGTPPGSTNPFMTPRMRESHHARVEAGGRDGKAERAEANVAGACGGRWAGGAAAATGAAAESILEEFDGIQSPPECGTSVVWAVRAMNDGSSTSLLRHEYVLTFLPSPLTYPPDSFLPFDFSCLVEEYARTAYADDILMYLLTSFSPSHIIFSLRHFLFIISLLVTD